MDKKMSYKKVVFWVTLVMIPVIVFIFIYLGFVGYRARELYPRIKSNDRGWIRSPHQDDKMLGFRPIPNAQGEQTFPIGQNIPACFDKDGFRVPAQSLSVESNIRPFFLFLGCSFTYGDGVPAEHAFPFLVGQYFPGTAKNAGVCGYGLAQMLLRAEELVMIYRPDYLVVQYSPWLIDRAIYPFPSTDWNKIPLPYFFERDGRLNIHPPIFQPIDFINSIKRYRNTPKTISDFLSFFGNVAFPMCLHDDFNMLIYRIKIIFGFPKPTNDEKSVVKFVYQEMSRLAKESSAKLIIVILGNEPKPVRIPKEFPKDAIIIDAQRALLNNLQVVDEEHYLKEYSIWRGSPLQLISHHPNEKAHKIIAEEIIAKIRETLISP